MLKVKEFEIKTSFFTVKGLKETLRESDCYEFYKTKGYNVYKNYTFYFRNKAPRSDRQDEISLTKKIKELNYEFPDELFILFNEFNSGEPDVLLEKDGNWFFAEIKTNNDSLKLNQLEFIYSLNTIIPTEVHYFITDTHVDTIQVPSTIPKKHVEKFKDFLGDIIKIQQEKFYKKYYVIVKVLLEYPSKFLTEPYLSILSENTNLSKGQITKFVSKKKEDIIYEELSKFSKKKELTKKELKLEKEYLDLCKI